MALPRRLPEISAHPSLTLVEAGACPTPSLSAQLWLALGFPALSLEAVGVRADEAAPVAILDGDNAQASIFAVTAGAARGGLESGMTPEAALALLPHVRFLHRNPTVEREALHRLAAWCGRFTPTISVQEPDALLLEVRGSLHLFGGPSELRTRLKKELQAENHRVAIAFAPTPRAALWLARAGQELVLDDVATLRGVLGSVPLGVLRWPLAWQAAFARLGLHLLRDLLRLPRDGLARRFGPELLDELDRALGARPDPLPLWRAPAHYEEITDLGFDTWQTGSLLPVIEQRLAKLANTLRCHDAGLCSFELRFNGYRGAATSVKIGTRDVTREVAHWMRLVRTELEALRLTHAVHTLRILAGPFEPFPAFSVELLACGQPSGALSLTQLQDLLRSRLGKRGVMALRSVATPRPERASRLVMLGKTKDATLGLPPRPLWFLDPPTPLELDDVSPVHRGRSLVLEEGPERIECGGWLNREIRRDYYVARDPRGSRLWVYRDLAEASRWYLQGYFA